MHILSIGGGGREHALAWKAAQSARVQEVFVAPGNAGTALEPKVTNVAIAATDIPALLDFAVGHNRAMTIVGPEVPLSMGIVDTFIAAGLLCFGPNRAAAQLEASKDFSKQFMVRHGIPTARYASFTELAPACAYIETHPLPLVVKADGLAAGKGVVIAQDHASAVEAVTEMLEDRRFGDAGGRVVIEAYLVGQEVSFMVVTDGVHIVPLSTTQDHKTRDNGGQGPNTGGMGAYGPSALVTPALEQRILSEIIQPTIMGMAAEGRAYSGFLYAGLMITESGDPWVLEFNVRLGDPETQSIMMRLQSDLVELCQAVFDHRLDAHTLTWDPRSALGVVLAAPGYPVETRTGDPIQGLDGVASDVQVFHAGTAQKGTEIVTAGGRVLCVTALGADLEAARRAVYASVDAIHWEGMHYRTDIGGLLPHPVIARSA